MGSVVKFPVQKSLAAVVPDVESDPLRGLALSVDPAVLEEIRSHGYVPLIVPVHDIDGHIDAAAHAYLRWGFEFIYASENLKNELNAQHNLWAVKEYTERLVKTRQDLAQGAGSEYGHPADAALGDHFDPRVLVAPDFKGGKIRLSTRFIDALRMGSKVIPVVASGAKHIDEELENAGASGILLPGSNSHYHPKHYGGAQDEPDEAYDLARDDLIKVAVEKAHRENIPLFGICSGMQGIVLFGDEKGRLIPDLHEAERPGHHISGGELAKEEFQAAAPVLFSSDPSVARKDKKPARFKAAHVVKLAPGSFLTHLVNLMFKFKAADQTNIERGFEIPVNSLHQQAIDERSVGQHLSVEGVAEDGTIEAVHSRNHKYILGVQFHPEAAFMKDVPAQNPLETALYRALFWSFGQAASDRLWKKLITRKTATGNWRNRGMSRVYMTVPGSIHVTPEFVTNGGFNGTLLNPMLRP